jgi:hypothetical protein
MTIVFQILAIVVIVAAAFFMLRGGGDRHQAIRRILMLLFIVAAASSVLVPQLWTLAAHAVGVGRGADLLLYLTVLIFIGFVATTYRRFRQLEREVTQLARKLALLDARERAADERASGSPQDPPAGS